MIILEEIRIRNFRNIKQSSLAGLKDLNIIVGPNNSGKTNVLILINMLRELSIGRDYDFVCKKCNEFKRKRKEIRSISLNVDLNDFYLRDRHNQITITLKFNEESVKKLIPGVIDEMRSVLQDNTCESAADTITLRSSADTEGRLDTEHTSPFINENFINMLKESILYIPEDRIKEYKGKNINEYIKEKNISGSRMLKLISLIKDIVDERIVDFSIFPLSLQREFDNREFDVSIDEQGSGVRSLICTAVDLLSENSRIVLIDEPEVGLNPHSKQEFLKFLIDVARDNETQIFIATHDPTFVNPNLFNRNDVAIYLFSPIEENFVKVDLSQNKEDPHIFAGFLPHTVSLKEIHLYVEGTSDVYIFTVFLNRLLKQRCDKNWFKILGKIGIFHLGGDFWSHLIYTIPRKPYRCLVVLDGEKREKLRYIVDKYNQSKVVGPKFKIIGSALEINEVMWGDGEYHPVYCLKKRRIEDYLFENSPPEGYDKVRDGPKIAESLEEIPHEIETILLSILPPDDPCENVSIELLSKIIKDNGLMED